VLGNSKALFAPPAARAPGMHGENHTRVVLHVPAGETAGDCMHAVHHASAAPLVGVGIVIVMKGDAG
jgi:hypothetical protein